MRFPRLPLNGVLHESQTVSREEVSIRPWTFIGGVHDVSAINEVVFDRAVHGKLNPLVLTCPTELNELVGVQKFTCGAIELGEPELKLEDADEGVSQSLGKGMVTYAADGKGAGTDCGGLSSRVKMRCTRLIGCLRSKLRQACGGHDM